MTISTEQVFSNARIVLPDTVVEGAVLVRDGLIADVSSGPCEVGEDMEGDYLLPGLVELHTDNLEHHFKPRPGVRWNKLAALQAHDAQVASSGITTVFDALRAGYDDTSDTNLDDMAGLAEVIGLSQAGGRLRADHFIHLRCEVSAPDCIASFEHIRSSSPVRLVSLMDHSPGQRQFATMEAYRRYYQGKLRMTDAELEIYSDRRTRNSERYAEPNRTLIATHSRAEGITLASHDDATLDHVARARQLGTTVAEFPTTIEAAAASRDAGMQVLMGAPNVVRGTSHTGNISARALIDGGLLDILSSDYIPFSLVLAAFALTQSEATTLPEAVALVSRHPAAAAGLSDRGEIATGKRADLVHIHPEDGVPIVRAVWRRGQRIC